MVIDIGVLNSSLDCLGSCKFIAVNYGPGGKQSLETWPGGCIFPGLLLLFLLPGYHKLSRYLPSCLSDMPFLPWWQPTMNWTPWKLNQVNLSSFMLGLSVFYPKNRKVTRIARFAVALSGLSCFSIHACMQPALGYGVSFYCLAHRAPHPGSSCLLHRHSLSHMHERSPNLPFFLQLSHL